MTVSSPTYDLVILLDPDAEEQTRAKIIADARSAIDASGEVLRHDTWGNRALSYPIQRRTSAEYHLLQLRAASPELLSRLNRSLRITDGILRFRIIKLKPGVPEPPDMATSGVVSGGTASDSEVSPSAPAGGAPPASGGGAQASGGVTPAGDTPAPASDTPAPVSDTPAPAADPPASGGDVTSGGDAATAAAAQAPEPGSAGSPEAAERVRADST
jgi:small subunit ribosomal protein S6